MEWEPTWFRAMETDVMMCYKDKSYCVWAMRGICKNTTCERAFTQKDHEEATAWWATFGSPGGEHNYPVMIADLQTPDCGARMV